MLASAMNLLTLAALFLAGVESRLLPREDDDSSWRPFGDMCWYASVSDQSDNDKRSYTLEGYCGEYLHKEIIKLELDPCVGNEDGRLVWRKDGSFSSTCERCVATERGPNVWLQCWCTGKDGMNAGLDEYPMLDLNEHIAWENGELKCKL